MITLLLYLALLSLPVISFRCNRRLRTPYAADLVCIGTVIMGALLLWGILHVFHAEFHAAYTEIYEREQAAFPDSSEFSPAGLASRTISVNSLPIVALAVIWYAIVCLTELFVVARRPNKRRTTQTQCKQCGNSIVADPTMAGLDGSCPQCKTKFTFPPAEPFES